MKITGSIFCLLGLLTAAPTMAHEDHGKPQYGGIVAEAGMAQFELVSREGRVIIHVSQHGAALASAGGSGKLTVLAGGEKSEIALKPAGENRFEGTGNLASGAKVQISIQLAGQKAMQARVVVK